MHQHTTDTAPTPPDGDGDYQWPTCTGCHRPLWETELGRHACGACQTRAARHLDTIRELHPLLNTAAALTPGARTTGGGGGSAPAKIHAPIPVRLDVLNLTAAGGIATRLQAIEDSWRLAFGRRIHIRVLTDGTTPTATDVPGHITFIAMNLERACESYQSIADDLTELARLATACRTALDPGPRPSRVRTGTCPTPIDGGAICGTPLIATTNRHGITCPGCGTRWDTLTAWRDLRAAQNALTRAAA